MNARTDRTTRTARWFPRLAAGGTVGAVVAISAMMLLTPLASATTISHPYFHFGVGTSNNAQKYGCATAKTLSFPKFGKRAGQFKGAGDANAPKCGASPIAEEGVWSGEVELVANIGFTTAASHSISANWKFDYSESWSETPFTGCVLNYSASYSTCAVDAESSIYAFGELWDETNSSWGPYGIGLAFDSYAPDIYNFSYAQNYSQNYCYAGSCSLSGGNFSNGSPSGTFTGISYGNVTFNLTGSTAPTPGDKYQLQIYLYVEAIAEAYTESATAKTRGTASASIDMATAARAGTLLSVTYV